jgi:F-type H+-transporting ATPase subunit delta
LIQSASNTKLTSRPPVDVGSQQVATRYAQALLDATGASGAGASGSTGASGKIEAALAELDSFVTEVLDKVPHLEDLFTSALVADDKKAALVDRLLKGRASPVLLNFLKTLARHGRLGILRSVHQVAQKLLDDERKMVRVEVATAAPLSDDLKTRLADSVRQMFGRTPILDVQVRPELIGGIMMRVGDTVYDGSIANRLEQFRQQMIDRSVHEIQSRRDSFSSPAGN